VDGAVLQDNPQAEDDLQLHRMLKSVINSAVSPLPIEDAIQDIQARLEKRRQLNAQNQKPQIASPQQVARPSTVLPDAPWWNRLWLPMPIPAPILASLLVVVVVPYILMGHRTKVSGLEQNSAAYRGTAHSPNVPCEQKYRIKLVFARQARMEDVSLLLGKLGGEIVDGPTVAGEYWVRVPTAAARQDAATSLKAQPWVDDVWVPPEDSTLGCR
jgi:hypothetical protein